MLNRNEINLTTIDRRLDALIYDKLRYNLKRWKRVEGSSSTKENQQFYSEANRHFYEEIFDQEVRKFLGEITGDYYPDWGTEQDNNLVGGYNKGTGTYVPVGLRWAEQFTDWQEGRSKGLTVKKIRMLDKQVVRPQIVVTMRPLDIYLDFKKRYDKAGPNPKENGKHPLGLVESKCKADPRWDKVEIIPFYVYLPTYQGTDQKKLSQRRDFNLRPNKDSRHQEEAMSSEHIDTALEHQIADDLLLLGREIASKWRK